MFITKQRDDGSSYVTLVDDAPEWARQMVQEAHDGELPNDWRYETIAALWEILAADPDADTFETADGLVDAYTSDLVAWLAGHLDRTSYVDDAINDGYGPDGGVVALLMAGQFRAIQQMAEIVADAIRENRS